MTKRDGAAALTPPTAAASGSERGRLGGAARASALGVGIIIFCVSCSSEEFSPSPSTHPRLFHPGRRHPLGQRPCYALVWNGTAPTKSGTVTLSAGSGGAKGSGGSVGGVGANAAPDGSDGGSGKEFEQK